MKTSVRSSVVLACSVAAALAAPSTGQAAQAGDLCHVRSGYTPVWKSPGEIYRQSIYSLFTPDLVRIEALYVDPSYSGPPLYRVHGDGKPTGYVVRSEIDQASCR